MPYHERGYWYYSRFETGKDYPIYARRKGAMDAAEEVLLDVNAMAAGKDYFSVGDWEVSQDNNLLAWAEDAVGRRQYTIKVKNLATGEIYSDEVDGRRAEPGVGRRQQDALLRLRTIRRRCSPRASRSTCSARPRAHDEIVYRKRTTASTWASAARATTSSSASRWTARCRANSRCAPAADPKAFAVLAPRERDVEYEADHHGGRWVIRTNADGAKNYKVVTAPDGSTSRKDWKDWIPHSEDVFIDGFELFDGFTAIAERSEGLERLRLLRADGKSEYVKADEPAYGMGLSVNAEPDTDWLRYTYTSMTTPATVYELNTKTGERKLMKRDPVIGYDPTKYTTERLWATARDGTKIPVSRRLQARASRRTAPPRCCSTPTAATVRRPTRASTCRR